MAGMIGRPVLVTLILAIIIVVVTMQSGSGHAFQFDLEARSFKCFKEELSPKHEVFGEYSAAGGYSQFIDFRVLSPSGVSVVDSKDINTGDFSFTTDEGGEYSFCFYNRLIPGIKFTSGLKRVVTFKLLTGTETFDYETLARKDQLKPIEVSLRMNEDIIKSLLNDFAYFKVRESDMRNTSESTFSRVKWVGSLSIVFAIVFTLGQVWYLKRFFMKKKLI